jgi:lipoyl synthase
MTEIKSIANNPAAIKLHTTRPEWLKVKAPGGESYAKIRAMMRSKSLHTVCEEAHCPNIGECWGHGTATFMILGDICIRNCRFCAITTGKPMPPHPEEPFNVAESIRTMNLQHAVITSVTRDDLQDGGANHWADTIRQAKSVNDNTTIEVLIPDFMGNIEQLKIVLEAKPDILNHNMETVPRIYDRVRPKAVYENSLNILKVAKDFGFITKSGLMVGIGEQKEEIFEVLKDLRKINVDIVTIGQYLQPTKKHLAVDRFVTPDEFKEYKMFGMQIGFRHVVAGPLVRSSYHAHEYK